MSIKKKLVTAVTTAGLLAGLFGSAFVPVAHAATTGAVAFTAASSAEDYNDTTGLIAYYSASVYPQATFTYTPAVGDDALSSGVYELVVSGGTIRSCTVASAGAGSSNTAALINAAQTSCLSTHTWVADGALSFNITLNKLAAGASATVTVVDPDGDTVTPTVAKTITGVAATELANAISISKTTAATKVGYDGDATYGATTDIGDTTIGGVEYIATAQNLGSEFQFGGGLKNAYGTALTTNTVIVATVTEGNYINCESGAAQDGTIAAGTASVMVLSITDDSGLFECGVVAVDGAEGLGGAVTATIKTVAGTVIKEISAGFLGEIASVEISAAHSEILTDAAGTVTDWLTVTAKDAAGRAYALKDSIDADNLETSAATALLVYDLADTTKADIASTTAVDADTDGIFDLENTLCANGDGPTSTGQETRSVAVKLEDGAGATITSNALTIKCGVDKDTALVVDRVELAATKVAPGAPLKAKVYLEDALGYLAAIGDASAADVALTLVGGTNTDLSDGDIELANTTILAGGYFEVTITASITVGTTITLQNVTAGSIARAYVTSDAYTAVLTVGPKKLKATADFGPAAASKKIAFVLENTSGTTKTFYRRANADGVATYTLKINGTWEVYATFGDEISDTGSMKK